MEAKNERTIFPKIIQWMKKRHLQGENYPICLDDILEELNINDVAAKVKTILDNDILTNNPKLEHKLVDGIKQYSFKPFYNLRNKKDLINLVRDHQEKGAGGVYLEDVQESLPRADDIIAKIDEIVVMTGSRKKKILYVNDKTSGEAEQIEDDLVKYWRNVAVDGLDETKIEEYLESRGITSMKDALSKDSKDGLGHIKPKERKRNKNFKKHNEHLGGLLNEYNPDLMTERRKNSYLKTWGALTKCFVYTN